MTPLEADDRARELFGGDGATWHIGDRFVVGRWIALAEVNGGRVVAATRERSTTPALGLVAYGEGANWEAAFEAASTALAKHRFE